MARAESVFRSALQESEGLDRTGLDETTREYVQRLEAMYDEQRLPSGDDLISDIERFLRDQGGATRG